MSKDYIKYLIYKFLSIDSYLRFIYRWHHGKKLNLKKPECYSEKLFWLKKFNGKQENVKKIQECYDKYNIREYVTSKNLQQIMPRLYGVYKNVDEIDFNKFPEKYVIKISQSCGYNFINNGTKKFDENDIRKKLNNWLELSKNKKSMTQLYKEESYYFDGNPCIICEEYLECADGSPCIDYGIFCFNGSPRFIACDIDAVDDTGMRKKSYYRNVYDLDWNLIPVNLGREHNEKVEVSKPKNLEKMIEVSKTLSEDFIFARVDLYNRDGEIFLGEITFIPQGASQKITPTCYDDEFGKWLVLPK